MSFWDAVRAITFPRSLGDLILATVFLACVGLVSICFFTGYLLWLAFGTP